jgi:hypothetical protein
MHEFVVHIERQPILWQSASKHHFLEALIRAWKKIETEVFDPHAVERTRHRADEIIDSRHIP